MKKFKYLLLIFLSLVLQISVYAEDLQDENNFLKEQTLSENKKVQSEVEADFLPYLLEVERRIRHNWYPNTDDYSLVTILLRIAKDGKLISTSIVKSGTREANELAIQAVNLSAPFDPLPESFKGDYFDINFEFQQHNISKNFENTTPEKPIGAFLKRLYNEFLQ